MKSFVKFLFLSLFLLLSCQYTLAGSKYVVANVSVAPVREKPSHAAEQATQLLLGELCEVVDRASGWIKIRSTVDGQVGWVTSSMLTSTKKLSSNSPVAVVVTPTAIARPVDGGAPILLTMGTRLFNYSLGTFSVLSKQYHIDPTCVSIPTGKADLQRNALMSIAKSLLNTPYLWGGKSAMGLDCSGFTQVVYAAVGINILRNAREQITQGKEVASLADALPGDLAFFDHSDRDPKATNISHVGMLISPTQIIHCAGGCVHIDRIDANGIHLSDGTMTHHLVQINRYL
jgi:hypothetical protein